MFIFKIVNGRGTPACLSMVTIFDHVDPYESVIS